MQGQFDTMRHNPDQFLQYHALDIARPIRFGDWVCGSVYVHDMRPGMRNGHVPQGPNNAFDVVALSICELRSKAEEATARMLMWPTGRDGTHVFGGAFHVGRCAFFVGRRPSGAFHKFLCAHVY